MKIAVIGSNGLISKSIGRYCNQNDYILSIFGKTIPENHQYDFFSQTNLITDEINCLELLDFDMVVYAAGAGVQSNRNENTDLIYSLNVGVPVKICNGLKMHDYKGSFVSFGSYFEIGENQKDHCFDETELLQSQRRVVNDYSVSKRMFSKFISSVAMPFITRHFILPTIYGECEAVHRLIPYTINALKKNTDIAFTSGEQVRQYIYIDEVVDIIFEAEIQNVPSGLYNISGTETFTVKELVATLFELLDKPLTESVFGKAERTDTGMKNLQLNGDKLHHAISYQPEIKLKDVYDRY